MADEQTLEEKLEAQEEAPPPEDEPKPKGKAKKSTAVAKQSADRSKIRSLIEAHKPQFELALAGSVDGDKFARVALTEILGNKSLMDASVPSLMGALLSSAQLGLEPGGPLGHCYLVPYKGEVQLILGYKGMEQLAYNSGLVSSINARVVRAGDYFEFEFGTNEHVSHRPKAGVGGEVTHAYAIARLVTGGVVSVVLFREDIDRRMASSASAKSKSSPWKTDYDAMARKSAIRALFNDLPASTVTQRALGYDERVVTPDEVDEMEGIIDVDEVEV